MVSHLKVEAISALPNLLQSEILQISSLSGGCSIFSCAGVKKRFFEGDVFPDVYIFLSHFRE